MTRTLLLLLVLGSLLPACGRYGPPVRRDRPTREATPVATPAPAPEPTAETRPDVPPGAADDAEATDAGDADAEDEEEAR